MYRTERVFRGVLFSAFQDSACNWMQLFAMFFQNRAQRKRTLGYPGAVIEDLLGFIEGCELDLHLGAAERSHPLDTLAIKPFCGAVSKEGQVICVRDAEAERARRLRHRQIDIISLAS